MTDTGVHNRGVQRLHNKHCLQSETENYSLDGYSRAISRNDRFNKDLGSNALDLRSSYQ